MCSQALHAGLYRRCHKVTNVIRLVRRLILCASQSGCLKKGRVWDLAVCKWRTSVSETRESFCAWSQWSWDFTCDSCSLSLKTNKPLLHTVCFHLPFYCAQLFALSLPREQYALFPFSYCQLVLCFGSCLPLFFWCDYRIGYLIKPQNIFNWSCVFVLLTLR